MRSIFVASVFYFVSQFSSQALYDAKSQQFVPGTLNQGNCFAHAISCDDYVIPFHIKIFNNFNFNVQLNLYL